MRNVGTRQLKKISYILLITFTLLHFCGLAPAFAGTPTETRITDDPKGQFMPKIYGSKVVWMDNRNNNWDIYMYDLFTEQETRVTTDANDQSDPEVYGDNIVWQDNRNGNWDIYMYNLSSGNETRLTSSNADQMSPAIYQDKIVWTDYRNRDRNPDIYMNNLTAKTETRITTDISNPGNPAVHGDKIIWEDLKNGNFDLYMYDMIKGTVTEVSVIPSDQRSPAVYGDMIVFQDNRNGSWDIYMYDLATGTESELTTDSNQQLNPTIFQDKVAWTEILNDNTNPDVYYYNLTTGEVEKLSTGFGDKSYPSIYGDKIVWEDGRSGDSDIYAADLNIVPALVTAVVRGNSLVLGYDVILDPGSVPLTTDFVVNVNGHQVNVTNVAVDGSDIILTMAEAVKSTDTVTIDYAAGANPIRNAAGEAASISTQPVINKAPDTQAPTWPGGSFLTVSDVGPTGLVLNWTAAADSEGVTRYRIYKNGVVYTLVNNLQSLNIAGLLADTTYTFKIEAGDEAGNWSTTGPLVTVTTKPADGLPPTTGEVNLGGAVTTQSTVIANKNVITVTVDEATALAALDVNGGITTAVISVAGNNDMVNARVTAGFMAYLAEKGAWLKVQTELGSYALPAAEIDTHDLARQLGAKHADLIVNIVIAKAPPEQADTLATVIARQSLTGVVDPVEFRVEIIAGNKTVVINNFSSYVIRTLNLPGMVDANKAVGVVLNGDGTVSPVPTRFIEENGRNIAVIVRKTNSIYTVTENKKTFDDISLHWARKEISMLGAKLIIAGTGKNSFLPQNKVTRAELVTIIVRALGLVPKPSAALFNDVRPGDWYAGAVGAAVDAGIVNGYPDKTFRPGAYVTREEVAAITVKALGVTGVDTTVTAAETDKFLGQFSDRARINTWAAAFAATAAKHGIVKGDTGKNFAPARFSTRAEAAVMVLKLLTKANFI